MTLADMRPGGLGRVTAVTGGPMRLRLMEMGFLPGTQVRRLRSAPLGDPLEAALRGYALSLRRSEARMIQVVEL